MLMLSKIEWAKKEEPIFAKVKLKEQNQPSQNWRSKRGGTSISWTGAEGAKMEGSLWAKLG